MDSKKKGFHIKWPWDIVLYAVLLVALRIFAIPVIAFLAAQNKKSAPDGPNDGYCMRQAHARLSMLLWALLYLVIAAAGGVMCYTGIADYNGVTREVSDYATLVISGLMAVGGLAAAVYSAFVGLRDSLFPEKGALAKSIREQVERPENYTSVKELFEAVDKDIEEYGEWFGNVAVGKEWILGPTASLISRVRAIFYRNEIRTRSTGKRVTTTRTIQLYVMDDEQRTSIYDLKKPADLEAIVNCVCQLAPDAVCKPYKEYVHYNTMKSDEWETFLMEYRRRAADRQAARQ